MDPNKIFTPEYFSHPPLIPVVLAELLAPPGGLVAPLVLAPVAPPMADAQPAPALRPLVTALHVTPATPPMPDAKS
jgi:hypothetical protein